MVIINRLQCMAKGGQDFTGGNKDSWLQSSVCIISFSSYAFYRCMQNWEGQFFL